MANGNAPSGLGNNFSHARYILLC